MAKRFDSVKNINKEKSSMKKLVSMLLALSMVLSVFCMIPMQVAASDIGGEEPSEPSNTIDKTASMLIADRTKVTLTVPGEQEDYSSDIVLIIGQGPASNYEYLMETIHRMLKHTDGTKTDIKLGLVGFADTTEEETVLELTKMQDTVPGNTVAEYRLAERYNDGKQYTESAEAYAARKAEYEAKLPVWAADPVLTQDMEYIIAMALNEAAKVYNGVNLESALITARDMLAADTTVPAHRKHMIVVSTGLTYWFDNDNGDASTVVGIDTRDASLTDDVSGNGKIDRYVHGFLYWAGIRNGSTNVDNGYSIPFGWDYATYWENIVNWVAADELDLAKNKYIFTPVDVTGKPVTYREFSSTPDENGNVNSSLYLPIKSDGKQNKNYRYGYVIKKPVDIATASKVNVPYVAMDKNSRNPAKNPNAAHAVNYERAQYEAWVVYNQMQTPIGKTFDTVLRDKNGQIITVEGLGYNCYAVMNGYNGTGPLENDKWLGADEMGHGYMNMLAGGTAPIYRRDTDFFAPIEKEILYHCGVGSIVEDYIGKNENGNFEFVKEPANDKETLQDIMYLTKAMPNGSTMVYTTAQVAPVYRTDVSPKTGMEYGQADASYTFTAEGASTPSFWLDYYYGDGETTEMFVWSFGEDVSRYYPVSLTYTLELTEKQPIPSTDGLGYDVNTNNSATLYPIDSNGNPRDPEIFPIPWVNYDVVDKTEIAIVLAVLPHLVANNLGEGQDHTKNALYNLLKPVMDSGLYDVRLGLITVEMQQQVLLDARSPESLLPENEADWVKMLNDILVPAKNLYVGPTGVENNINRAIEMFGEQDANGNSLDHIDAANKYFYLVATGRSYWFENDEGQALTIATKVVKNNVTYAIWNERTWKIARNGNANVYPVPVYFGTGADAYEKYFKWFSDLAKNDGYDYAYIVNCGSENNANFKNWAKTNGTELRAGANNASGDRYASFIVDPNSDSDLYGSGFLYYDANVGFDVNVLPNGKHNAMNLSNTKADPANVAHALNYEVGQYEAYLAWMKMLDEGYNCISVCSEDVRYQNYSPYLAQGSWNYSSPQIGHSFMDYLAKQNETQTAASLIYVMSDPTATTYANSGAAGTYYNVMTTNFFPAVVDSEDNLLDYHLNKNTTPALAVEPRPRLLFANPPKPQAAPVITEQPAVTDIAAKNNEIINASIQATGKEISYKWFFVDANGNEIPAGVETNVFNRQMKPEYDKLSLKCKVTDKNGKSVESNAIRLSYVPTELKILAQSEAIIVADNNDYAFAYVNAQGEGLTYVWYVKERGSAGWNTSSLNSPVYAAKMSPAVSGRQVKCVIFDKFNGFVESQTITLTCSAPVSAPSVSKELKITNVLPEAITVAKKATATVTIEAQGEGLTYTWYFQNDGANNWSKASETGNTYSLAMTAGRSGRKVYCEVTDINGNMVKSAVVTLLMEGAK